MGYQRTIPRGIVFGTKYSGGLGFTHIGAIQTAQKICGAVKHIRVQSKIGRKCIVMLRWAQVFLGMNVPVLEETRNVDHLEGRWIRTLLQDMQKIKCKIQLHSPWLVQPHRENDKHIMDAIMNDEDIPTQHRHTINRCRIYMQHTFFSEITSSDGNQIIQQIFEHNPPNCLDHSPEHDWPRQTKPNTASWKNTLKP